MSDLGKDDMCKQCALKGNTDGHTDKHTVVRADPDQTSEDPKADASKEDKKQEDSPKKDNEKPQEDAKPKG